jgi:hypothetical protein
LAANHSPLSSLELALAPRKVVSTHLEEAKKWSKGEKGQWLNGRKVG